MIIDNPVLPGTYPDPTICRVGDDYWLVTSTFAYVPGLPVFHSRDLVHWEQVGHVVDRDGMVDLSGATTSGGMYAPTLRHHDGVFYLVCTLVSNAGGARGGNFVVTATDPAGPWSDPVWWEGGGIDPSLFFDDDGRVWAHGTRLAEHPEWDSQTEVWLRALDPETLQLTGPEHILWTGAVRGAVWAEGPHLYTKDGTYYLLASEGGTDFHHALSVARSATVEGPYEGNKGNPVLTHRHLGRGEPVVGVGHADLVEGPDGSWWAVLLGMRTYGGYHYNLGRETFLVPVEWQDGWPVFAPGQGRVPQQVDVPFASPVAVGAPQHVTAGVVRPDDVRWTAMRRPPSAVASPSSDGAGWDLRVQPATLADLGTPTFLGVRQQHQDVDVRAVVQVTGLADGETAGVVVRQSEKDHATLGVTRTGDAYTVRAVHRRGGVDTVLGEAPAGVVDGAVTLGVSARGQDYALVVETPGVPGAARTVAVADGRTLDSVAAGGFTGVWLGVYATSHGTPSTSVVTVGSFAYTPY
ncbi:glycoside hydrolase family 43 protein [Xylanimonas protaetiae]|uniref:Glycoside hydrolase family 43 protein n=1 Tax=Xylanimonas protaetiae TaxID=2509457 RepID=A0A4P6EZT7_9MICO|nr:glycoside hydrolase family 43 protein [Xylanimonas protaetiae]QAY68980.1 glycoside hydrolase family 43 protein [Xylanimonas protaetiae]